MCKRAARTLELLYGCLDSSKPSPPAYADRTKFLMCGRRTFNALMLSEYFEYINLGLSDILSDFSEVR